MAAHTQESSIQAYFQKFGEVESISMFFEGTSASVQFGQSSKHVSRQEALEQMTHTIDNKVVDVTLFTIAEGSETEKVSGTESVVLERAGADLELPSSCQPA